jgi:hypothetical protein
MKCPPKPATCSGSWHQLIGVWDEADFERAYKRKTVIS